MTQVFCNLSHSELQFGGRKEGSKIVAPSPDCITEIPPSTSSSRPLLSRREKGKKRGGKKKKGNFCCRLAAGKRQARARGCYSAGRSPQIGRNYSSMGKKKGSCAGGEAPGKMLQGRREGSRQRCSEPRGEAELAGMLPGVGGDVWEARLSRTEQDSLPGRALARAAKGRPLPKPGLGAGWRHPRCRRPAGRCWDNPTGGWQQGQGVFAGPTPLPQHPTIPNSRIFHPCHIPEKPGRAWLLPEPSEHRGEQHLPGTGRVTEQRPPPIHPARYSRGSGAFSSLNQVQGRSCGAGARHGIRRSWGGCWGDEEGSREMRKTKRSHAQLKHISKPHKLNFQVPRAF